MYFTGENKAGVGQRCWEWRSLEHRRGRDVTVGSGQRIILCNALIVCEEVDGENDDPRACPQWKPPVDAGLPGPWCSARWCYRVSRGVASPTAKPPAGFWLLHTRSSQRTVQRSLLPLFCQRPALFRACWAVDAAQGCV